MANTFALGGSPLGLIGVLSRPTPDGMSTFNSGESRNVNVLSYNTGQKQLTNLKNGSGSPIEERVSLFTGGSIPNFWANIDVNYTNGDSTGLSASYNGINRQSLHNDSIYDTSLLNIIEQLSKASKSSLRPQDFAYLKHLGVFPNNRLMIARRFPTPMRDNIMDKGGEGVTPLSVLISWKPQNEDFLDFSFGEEWMDAEADFTSILSQIGGDFGIKNMGAGVGKGINILPLPGFTELLQRKFMTQLGILSPDRANQILPSGNPNIIKKAKRRKTIAYGDAGSGLKATVNIKMVVEYEQKFISGIDPTVAWMDILNNALSFGTSNSDNYGLSTNFAKTITKYTGNNAIQNIIADVVEVFKSLAGKIKKSIDGLRELMNKSSEDIIEKAKDIISGDNANIAINLITKSINATIRKYQVQVVGIAHALSGLPSTPWHITLGNPLRPIYTSGDMLVEDVNVKLGSTLAFNDLPASIKVEFTMTNARPLGLQELLSKFNTGYLRSVNHRKDFMINNISNNGSAYYTPIAGDDTDPPENTLVNTQQYDGVTPNTSSNTEFPFLG